MLAALKDLSHQKSVHLVFVFSLFASSWAVLSDEKKWLYNALLSLPVEVAGEDVPSPWDNTDPDPSPTADQWSVPENFEDPRPLQAAPSAQDPGQQKKRGRHSITPYQLLCCNVPPTRPPNTSKNPRFIRGNIRLRRLVLSAIEKSLKNRSRLQGSERRQLVDQPDEMMDRPYFPFYDAMDARNPVVERRGVTIVKSGVSGINTG